MASAIITKQSSANPTLSSARTAQCLDLLWLPKFAVIADCRHNRDLFPVVTLAKQAPTSTQRQTRHGHAVPNWRARTQSPLATGHSITL